ncbi:hypothetical protein [Luteococcus sp.]|uniref:hypothetical protein n=1 Tax=Luteococcus sp. TaxID=1969402 RepID=UPI0037364F18
MRNFATTAALAMSLALALGACSPTPEPTPAPKPPSATATPDPTAALRALVPGLLPAGSSAGPLGPYAPTQSQPPSTGTSLRIDLTRPADQTVGQWTHANVGLSFEATELADPRWEPEGSPLATLLHGLDGPSLRFGGNRVDRSLWWTSRQEARPAWATQTVTPADLQRLGRMAETVDATVTLVLPLGHKDPERAADMALHARRALGKRLLGVSIGNEPNGYALASQEQLRLRDDAWSPQQWVGEARQYVTAIHRRVPGLPVAGPGAYDATWWRAFGDARLPGTVAMSQHWYPLWSCPDRVGERDAQAAPTVANLTSPALHDRASEMVQRARRTAAGYELPLWLEEAGPTSCGGAAVSRSHAHALWSVDFLLNAARNGARRSNLHSTLAECGRGNPMSPVCTPPGTRSITGTSTFTAMLFTAQVRPGTIRQVTTSDPAVIAYTVTSGSGTDLVLVNLHDPATSPASTLALTPPKGLRATHGSSLRGTALDSRSGTTMQPLARPGTRKGAAGPTVVEPGSALLVRFSR